MTKKSEAQIVLVTGGSRGIGLSIVKKFKPHYFLFLDIDNTYIF